MDHKDSAETVSYKKLRLIRKIAISSRIRLPARAALLLRAQKGFGFTFSIIDCRDIRFQ